MSQEQFQLHGVTLHHAPLSNQIEFLQRHGRAKGAANNSEMGTGKTYAFTLNIIDLYMIGEIDAVLIIAPNGVHTNWTERELPKMMPPEIAWKARAWTSNTSKRAKAHFEVIMDPAFSPLRIAAFNWEALQHSRSFDAIERFCESTQRLLIICDESDNMKNPQSMRFKNLWKVRGYSRYRRTASGTPINNGPFDAFAQYRFLDTSFPGTTSFAAFKSEYAEMEPAQLEYKRNDGIVVKYDNPIIKKIRDQSGNNRTPQIVQRDKATGQPKYRNLDKLNALLAPHTYRVLKSECLDLPEKLYKQAFYELTPQQRKHYELAEEEALLTYQNDETPIAKLTVITKLAQISSGYYIHPYAPDELQRIDGPTPKLDLFKDRVATILAQGASVIVWARFHAEIDDIVAALKENEQARVVQYHGRIDEKERHAAIDAFQNGEANVFVGQQQAGGSGITLTAATYMIYYSNDFSLRNRLQSEDRAHRIGQKNNVTYIDLTGIGTIDERIVAALRAKEEIADIITGDGARLLPGKASKRFQEKW